MYLIKLFFFIFLFFSSSVEAEKFMYKNDYFSLNHPQEFHVKKEKSLEDFELYSIARGNKSYAMIYIGNQPAAIGSKSAADGDVLNFQAPKIQMISKWRGDDILSKEILIDLSSASNNKWPLYLSLWTNSELTRSEIIITDKIISSLRVFNNQ